MRMQKIFSVHELTRSIKSMLEGRYPFLSVVGEVTNLRKPGSGHLYFTLKDDRAQIKAVLFKMQQRYLKKQPKDGDMVVCRGKISVYEPRGDYQLIVDGLDYHGAGALQRAFAQLKEQLAAEGLFDASHKKDLPLIPTHVTLVTSPNGAAVHDFIRIAQNRFPQIQLSVYPVAVQGAGAAVEICRAIKEINDQVNTDIIVLTRGGGSIEDLQAFNDEALARTIYASRLPVVSAVGHEIDFTIADFAADLRAPTPSGAAEMLLPDSRALAEQIQTLKKRLIQVMVGKLERHENQIALYRQQLVSAAHPVVALRLRLINQADRLTHTMFTLLNQKAGRLAVAEKKMAQCSPGRKIDLLKQQLQSLSEKMTTAMQGELNHKDQQLAGYSGLLHAVSPLSTLARGYAVARKKTKTGKIITEPTQVRPGESIEVILARGRLDCTVTGTTNDQTGPPNPQPAGSKKQSN